MQTKDTTMRDSTTSSETKRKSFVELVKESMEADKTVSNGSGTANVAEPSVPKQDSKPVKSEAPLPKKKGRTPTNSKTGEKSTGSYSLSKTPSGKTKTKALRAEKFWKSRLAALHNSKLSADVVSQCSALADQSGASVSYFVAGALLQSANQGLTLKESIINERLWLTDQETVDFPNIIVNRRELLQDKAFWDDVLAYIKRDLEEFEAIPQIFEPMPITGIDIMAAIVKAFRK